MSSWYTIQRLSALTRLITAVGVSDIGKERWFEQKDGRWYDRREGDYYIGRTEFCSPEVDPEVLIPVANRRLRRGCFYDVKIIGAEEFDLYGDVISLSK